MKTILVPIDFSKVTKVVVAAASTLARATNARIVLLNVVQPPAVSEYSGILESVVPLMHAARKASKHLLLHWQKELRERHQLVPQICQRSGLPFAEIIAEATALKPDYILMGCHGHTAFYDLIMGSTTSGVIKRAPCPVVVVPTQFKSTRKTAK